MSAEIGSIEGSGPTLTEKPERVRVSRLTVVEKVYVQFDGEQPEECSPSPSEIILTEEEDCQVYERKTSAHEDWEKIDFGWIENPSCVVIENTHRVDPQVIPTPEELEELSEKVLMVRFAQCSTGQYWEIGPGQSMRGKPIGALKIRSFSGSCRYTIRVVPE